MTVRVVRYLERVVRYLDRRPALLHAAAVTAVLAAGLWLRASRLGGPDFGFDEFYHVFAARSLLDGSGLELAEGRPYERAGLVTVLTALAFALFGESEASARLPALVCGVALMVVVYAGGRALFGATAGLVALALTALSPDLIDVARFARLYSPFVLLYLGAALAGYLALSAALDHERSPRIAFGWLLVAGALGLVALHLHTGALGLGVTAVAYLAVRSVGLAVAGRRREAAPYGLLAAALALAAAALLATPEVRALIRETALTPLDWYVEDEAGAASYHYYLAWQYGWLWYLVWPATIAAVVLRPRPGVFLAVAFWVPFVLISAFVATRAPRYVSHLLPFAWLLLGAAAGAAATAGRSALQARLETWVPGQGAGRRAARAAGAACIMAAAILPPIRVSPSVKDAAARPSRTVGAFATGHFAGWRTAAPLIAPRLSGDAAIVSTVPLASRYYLGRPAVRLLGPGRSRDPWIDVGRTVVQHAADLEALGARHERVVVVLEWWRWKTPGKVDGGLRKALAGRCTPLTLPDGAALVAFECGGAVGSGSGGASRRRGGRTTGGGSGAKPRMSGGPASPGRSGRRSARR